MNTSTADSASIEEISREIQAKHQELAASPADPGLIPAVGGEDHHATNRRRTTLKDDD